MRVIQLSAALLVATVVLPGCGDGCAGDKGRVETSFDARARRVLQPPPGEVRPVPPHAIHAGGIGPYLLGTSLKDVLGALPHGPRVVLMEIDGVVDYSLVRAEGDALIIGVERPDGVTFSAVLDEEIARTERGASVGMTGEAVDEAMGPRLGPPTFALDPRLRAYESLPSARFVLDDDRVVAVVVRRPERAPEGAPHDAGPADGPSVTAPACALPEDEAALAEEVRAAARVEPQAPIEWGCFEGNEAAALVVADDRVVIVAGPPSKLRRTGLIAAPGAVFAAPVQLQGESHAVIAVASESRQSDDEARAVSVEVHRMEGGRPVRIGGRDVYRVTSTSAAWSGAKLSTIELLLELHGAADHLQVTGIYMHRGADGPADVAPLLATPVPVRPRRGVPSSPPVDAAAPGSDAGPRDDAGPGVRSDRWPPVPIGAPDKVRPGREGDASDGALP